MSALIPNQKVPVLDGMAGLMSRAWFTFLTTLTALPSAKLSATLSYNPPNILAAGTTAQAVTVPGAVLGYDASASFSLDLTGLVLTAYVSATDTVTAVLFNPTAGAINLGAGTLTAYAWKP